MAVDFHRLACVLGIALLSTAAAQLSAFQPPQHATSANGGELGPATSVNDPTECAAKCLSQPACISFNTHNDSSTALQCQLNGYSRVWAVNRCGANASFYQRLQLRNDTQFKQAVPWALEVPTGGVVLHSGPLRDAFDGGIKYLLQYDVDDLLWNFRKRAGIPQAPGAKCHGWDCREDWVEGSVAALFLMGAGGHLRWEEHKTLRGMMDKLIEGIYNCTESDGYLAAFPQDKLNSSEHPDYTTSWTVHGFLEAAIAGNAKALPMIRKHMNLFNNHTLLPTFLPPDGGNWPWQGIIHSTRMALSPLGTQADVDLVARLYQEDWWLRALSARDKQVIGRKLFDAHNYQLTAVEAYMDMYILTGNQTYLDAVMGAWEMHRDPLEGWIHVGGSIAINEGAIYDPGTYHLVTGGHNPIPSPWPTGEFCGAVFWLKLNQRMHRLWPDNETFVAEIERELFNEGLGHQDVNENGIRYFSVLNGLKQPSENVGTCCEGQGSRLYGSLNEYLFSTLPNGNGVFVDIYADASIVTTVGSTNATANISVITKWPYDSHFRVTVDVPSTVSFDLALRIPSWVEGMVMVYANEHSHASYAGEPGSYLHVNQTWKTGWSCLDFAMPAVVKAHYYTGVDQIQPFSRYSFTHGPTLLAIVGVWNSTLGVIHLPGVDPTKPLDWMIPHEGEPLHWTIAGVPNARVVPAWEITDSETYFSVYPTFDH